MIEIQQLATNLTLTADGLWVPSGRHNVSYPDDGHQLCFEVEDHSFWFNHRNDVITSLAQAYPPRGAVFDVGGGNGYVSAALQQAGFDTVLLEPGPEGTRNAQARGLNVIIQSTLQDAGFRPDSIAAFGLFDVLEHIEADVEFLRTLHGHLSPQGYLYVTVPAYQSLWSIDDVTAGHYRRYTTRTLKSRLESAGFTIRYCSYFFWMLVPAVFLLRSLPSRLGFRRHTATTIAKQDHSLPAGMAGAVLKRCLAFELNQIRARRRMWMGSSCIAVAQKGAS